MEESASHDSDGLKETRAEAGGISTSTEINNEVTRIGENIDEEMETTGESIDEEMETTGEKDESINSLRSEDREVSTEENQGSKEAGCGGSTDEGMMNSSKEDDEGGCQEDVPPLLSTRTTREDEPEASPVQVTQKDRHGTTHQEASKCGQEEPFMPPLQTANKTEVDRAQILSLVQTDRMEDEANKTPHEAENNTEENMFVPPFVAVNKTEVDRAQILSLVQTDRMEDEANKIPHEAENNTEENVFVPPFVAVNKTEDITDKPSSLPPIKMQEQKERIPPLLAPSKIKDVSALPTTSLQPKMLKVVLGTNPPTRINSLPSVISTNNSSIPAFSTSSMPPNTNTSNVRLVQTMDGRKLLLTNVVNVTKALPTKPVIFLSKSQASAAPASNTAVVAPPAPCVTPLVSANMPQTIILNPARPQTPQPIVLRIPGINQPILVRQQTPNLNQAAYKSGKGMKKTTATPSRATPAFTTTTTAVPGPITSPAKAVSPVGPLMFVQSGSTKFKVVGKPVPVKLFPKVQKIAPKNITTTSITTTTTTTTTTLPASPITQPSLKTVRKVSSLAPPPVTLPAGPTKAPLSEPPAYLNIRVKEERMEQGSGGDAAAAVKTEPPDTKEEDGAEEEADVALRLDTLLDVRIKEEATDEHSELLARDEQLQEVLGVTNTHNKDQPQPQEEQLDQQQQQLLLQQLHQHQQLQQQQQLPPQLSKFYIRTPEGKLVSISPEEAQALGLNHNDKVGENQRRLMNALSSTQTIMVNQAVGAEIAAKLRVDRPKVLIPGNVNVKDFVSCHVSPAAEKTAAIMKTLAGRRLETPKSFVAKCNTAIIGEFEGEDGKRYLRITIETEANGREPCNVPITPFNTYQCPFCAKDFKIKDHVVSHIRIHTGERPYPCDVCGKRYRQRIDIIRHMRIHTGEKPFNCGLCNASFNQKSNLRSHMRIHTGERPVQCKVCGKGFSRNTHLKQHMKLHTGEKPFKCKVCSRPFRFKSGLQAHERIHTGLKPYACAHCGRTFTQVVGLIRHQKTHEGEKPFRCQNCGKSFDTQEALESHLQKHTGERPHSCNICGKTFTDVADLRSHHKKYHINMLICVICFREDFKDRIELREHLRAHERQNWEETPEGDLVPLGRPPEGGHFISVDDTLDEDGTFEREEEMDENYTVPNEVMFIDENHVEVELDPDDPMEEEDESRGQMDNQNDLDSDSEDQGLKIQDSDPLA